MPYGAGWRQACLYVGVYGKLLTVGQFGGLWNTEATLTSKLFDSANLNI